MHHFIRKVVQSYKIALPALGCLLILLHGLTVTRLEQARHISEFADKVTQQSDLIHRIVASAHLLQHDLEDTQDQGEELIARIETLQKSLDAKQAEFVPESLTGMEALSQFISNQLSDHKLEACGELASRRLTPRIKRFSAGIDQLLAAKTQAEVDASVERLTAMRDTGLARVIREISAHFAEDYRTTHRITHIIETVNLVIVLITLLFIGLFVFRPLQQRLSENQDRLSNAEAEIQQTALRDPATNLPNQLGLHQFLRGLQESTPEGAPPKMALMVRFLSLSQSRQIPDEAFTRELTAALALHMQREKHDGVFMAHLGQAQFFVVRDHVQSASELPDCIKEIEQSFEAPLSVAGHRIQLRVITGFHVFTGTEDTDQTLSALQLAHDQALLSPTHPHIRYSEELRVRHAERQKLAEDLQCGLERGEIRAHFQPQINMRTNRITGFEALVRWYHPTRGLLSPGMFLPIAEDLGLDDLLGEKMLEQSLTALQQWDKAGYGISQVGINFSKAQLQNTKLVEYLKWELDTHNLTPERVAIEVLETIHVENDQDQIVHTVQALSDNGFRIDLDDFGTGSASVTGLRRFHAHRIKIDRSFITDIDKRSDNQQMVSIMMHLARSLGLDILAEGVEREEEADALRKLGCFAIQGYLFAKPMALEDTHDWIEAHNLRTRDQRGSRSIAV